MIEIVLASHNRDKISELESLIDSPAVRLSSMRDHGFDREIVEDGTSYAANALIKARAVYAELGGFVLADDSGLSVDALNGYPGIYSARFAGETTAYSDKIGRLWQLLEAVPEEEWTASFCCALALIEPDGQEHVFEGRCQGRIIAEQRGHNGFGYDPIFYLDSFGQTTAEMSAEQKNEISHRGLAMKKLVKFLRERGWM